MRCHSRRVSNTKDKMIGGSEKLNKGFQTAMKTLDRGRLHLCSVGWVRKTVDRTLVSYSKDESNSAKRSPNSNFFRGCSPIARQSATRPSHGIGRRIAGTRVKALTCWHPGCKLFTEMVGRWQIDSSDPWRRWLHRRVRGDSLYKDVRLFRIYEGTSQIQQTIIAKKTTERLIIYQSVNPFT